MAYNPFNLTWSRGSLTRKTENAIQLTDTPLPQADNMVKDEQQIPVSNEFTQKYDQNADSKLNIQSEISEQSTSEYHDDKQDQHIDQFNSKTENQSSNTKGRGRPKKN